MVNWSKSIKHLLGKKYLRMNRSTINHRCWCQVSSKTQRYILFSPKACTAIETKYMRLQPLRPSRKIASTAEVENSYLYYSSYQKIEKY